MPIYHFEPGAGARDWRTRAKLTAFAPTITGIVRAARAIATGVTTFGRTYEDGGGYRHWVEAWRYADGSEATYAFLQYPFFSIDLSVYLGPSIVLAESQVILRDSAEDVVDCDSWSNEFTQLEWLIDGVEVLPGGSSVLPTSGGPYVHSGDSYDERENITWVLIHAEDQILSFGGTGCGPDEPEYNTAWAPACLGGYGYWDGADWAAHAVTVDDLSPPSTSCTCAEGLPSATETDSYNVTVTSDFEVEQDPETISVTCRECYVEVRPPHEIICVDILYDTVYHVTYDYRHKVSAVGIQAEANPHLHLTRRTRRAGCSSAGILTESDYTEVVTTEVEAITFCEVMRQTHRYRAEEWCTGGAPPYTGVPCRPRVRCHWLGRVVTDWPERPSCGDCTDASYDVSRALDHVRTQICDGRVRFGWAPNADPTQWTDVDTGIAADWARIRFDHSSGGKVLLLFSGVGGAATLRTSATSGRTWESPVTIAISTLNGSHETTKDGRRVFITIEGASTPYDLISRVWDAQNIEVISETVIDTNVDVDGLDTREFVQGGNEWKIGLTYRKAGQLLYKTSPDGVTFS